MSRRHRTIAPLIAAIAGGRRDPRRRPDPAGRPTPASSSALVGLAIVAAVTITIGAGARRPRDAFGGAYRLDALTTFLDLLFIAIVALTIVFAPDYLEPRGLPLAEFAVVLVFAMTGAMLLAASADLLLLFLGLELMVLPGYMLVGFHKRDGYSTEGAIKYFLLGSFSSAIFLFGLAFMWGLTGSTRIDGVAGTLPASRRAAAPFARARDGPRVHDHRRRVQDRRGAVPLLDAGRVPGLADAGHRLPVGGPEGRRVRADPAPVRRGPRAAEGGLAAGRRSSSPP